MPEFGAIRVENADCFDLLNTVDSGSVDLILTDPPYYISRETGFSGGEKTGKDTDRFRVSYEFGEWDNEGESSVDFARLSNEFYRVLRPGGTVICFFDLWKLSYLAERFTAAGFKQLRFGEWVKTNPTPINSKVNYLTNAREVFISAVKKGKPTFNSEYDNALYSYPIFRGALRIHPTQKSLPLFQELIRKHSNPGDLVLDPFLGGGTTAYASFFEGRRCIAGELNQDYVQSVSDSLDSLTDGLF